MAETGWTKPLPTADGDYFSRADEYDKWPTLIRIENGAVYEMGQGGNLVREYAAEDYEYLGPISPSDFEQLTRLRDAAEVMDAASRFALMTPGLIRGRDQLLAAAEALRAVLDTELTQRPSGGK